MHTTIERYDIAVAGFRARLEGVDDDALGAASPCEGWTARDVVVHATDVLERVGDMVGTTAPHIDGPALVRFDAASAVLRDKVDDPALAATVVASPFGELAFKQLVSSVVVHDLLVHTWDLARATGGDERLDEALVAHTDAQMRPFGAALRDGHGFGAEVDPPIGADAQTRLLCFLGRRP